MLIGPHSFAEPSIRVQSAGPKLQDSESLRPAGNSPAEDTVEIPSQLSALQAVTNLEANSEKQSMRLIFALELCAHVQLLKRLHCCIWQLHITVHSSTAVPADHLEIMHTLACTWHCLVLCTPGNSIHRCQSCSIGLLRSTSSSASCTLELSAHALASLQLAAATFQASCPRMLPTPACCPGAITPAWPCMKLGPPTHLMLQHWTQLGSLCWGAC